MRSPLLNVSPMLAVLFTQGLFDAVVAYQNGIYLDLRPFVGLTDALGPLGDLLKRTASEGIDHWDGITIVTESFAPLGQVMSGWYEANGSARMLKLFACFPQLRDLVIAHAVFNGNLPLLSLLPLEILRAVPYTLLDLASWDGHLNVLEFLHSVVGHEGCTTWGMNLAARYGHLDVVRYLHERRSEGCSDWAVVFAAENGHVEVVKFLHNYFDPSTVLVNAALKSAAGNNRLAVATYIIQVLGNDERNSTDVIEEAARKGHLEMVQLLHLNSFACTTKAMDDAAVGGHLEVVQWLHSHRTEGCTTRAMNWAASNGHLKIVQWLHANRQEGCTNWGLERAATLGHRDVVEFLVTHRHEVDAKVVLERVKLEYRYDAVAMLESIMDKPSLENRQRDSNTRQNVSYA
ncbi:hypothetical protein AaE_010077 [Aphanomyces astaci]|uniref:Uncharacterized protein n=1 Tax=Aphanomyces astaci TaxID=112090 RepID=A0A6A5A8Q2_APHAT|nr:hypothetical protein AaE_010077 [Aphanomyces astaci]